MQSFLLFFDGSKSNVASHNVKMVSIYEALMNPTLSDWDCNLTAKENMYVKKHWDHFVHLGLAELAPVPLKSAERYTRAVAESIHECQRRYTRGVKLTNGNYSWNLTDASDDDMDATVSMVHKCAQCGTAEAKSGDYKDCAKCRITFYCSRSCQKAHWKVHKKSCCKD
jgi:hypothetical protein